MKLIEEMSALPELSTAIAKIEAAHSLPGLVDRASQTLASARTAAEVLEARDMAAFAYDAAKRTARLAEAKGAHDTLIAAAHRAQAHALEIESRAKHRLADEYDAAQKRGEVASQGKPSKGEGLPTVADAGLTHKDIHEARQVRDAEKEDPGIVKRTLDECISNGKEPSKSALKHAVAETAKRAKLKRADAEAMAARAANGEALAAIGQDYGLSAKGASAIISNALHGATMAVPEGSTVEAQVRKGMAMEAEGLSADKAAKEVGIGQESFRRVRELIVLLDEVDLNAPDRQIVAGAISAINQTKRIDGYSQAEHLVLKVWGEKVYRNAKGAKKRLEHFARVVGQAVSACDVLMIKEFEPPYLTDADRKRWLKELESARRNIDAFMRRLKE